MMGSTDDPKDGAAVAATVFAAVAVYGVRLHSNYQSDGRKSNMS